MLPLPQLKLGAISSSTASTCWPNKLVMVAAGVDGQSSPYFASGFAQPSSNLVWQSDVSTVVEVIVPFAYAFHTHDSYLASTFSLAARHACASVGAATAGDAKN